MNSEERNGGKITLREFVERAEDAAFVGDASMICGHAEEVFAELERLRAELSALRIQRATERARDGWAEVERLRDALRAIAEGFGAITGSVDDPSAKQVDGYFRGYAQAALEKGGITNADVSADRERWDQIEECRRCGGEGSL